MPVDAARAIPVSPAVHDTDVVVVGGGMCGLSAADAVARRGLTVHVVEAGETVGGLARAVHVADEAIEPYYHHLFPQDAETLDLIRRLGLEGRLEWRRAPMAVMHGGKVLPFDGPLDVLRFSAISFPQRVRLAAATAAQVIRRDHAALDRAPVHAAGPRWFGSAAYRTLWQPLFDAKFGPYAQTVPMAWLVARIRQRAGGRRASGDRLGYLRGSLGMLADGYAAHLGRLGAVVDIGTIVRSIARTDDGWSVQVAGARGKRTLRARAVVACVGGPILERLVPLPAAYAATCRDIPYRGVVCVLLQLRRRLSRHYWVNVTDRLGLGCVGIIEHTNFIPEERYGGAHLLYLAHYVETDGPVWDSNVDELIAAVEPALRALNPAFDRSWIIDAHLSRDAFAQPVPQVGGPMPGLTLETGLPGLIHASLAHIYPEDRGVSESLALGRRAGGAAVRHVRR